VNPTASSIVVAAALLAQAACNAPGSTATTGPAASASAAPPAASSAPPSPSAVGAAGRELLAEARRCVADPRCQPAEAEALYRRADDAGAPGLSCFDFYYGVGIAVDLPRARACFERKARVEKGCADASPGLDRLYLAAMLIDAQGGDADPARATALLADCFADAGVAGLRDEARKRASLQPSRAPLDFCKDLGGTPLTMRECRALDADRATASRRRVDRVLGPRLDAEGQKLADRARDLWSAFARLEAEAFSDKHRGGPLRANAQAAHEAALEQQRLDALAHFADRGPGAGDPVAAARELKNAYRAASKGDADHQRLFAQAREAWLAYRAAEVALHARLSPDEPEVRRDVGALLDRRYQALLEEALMP
jgi:hypothetical protein